MVNYTDDLSDLLQCTKTEVANDREQFKKVMTQGAKTAGAATSPVQQQTVAEKKAAYSQVAEKLEVTEKGVNVLEAGLKASQRIGSEIEASSTSAGPGAASAA